MENKAAETKAVYVNSSCADVRKLDSGSAADRARAASIIMRYYGDNEMADTLATLSSQLDFGDSGEAADAIGRTQEKLDTLIGEREKRRSADYIHMMTEEQIKNAAGGEVTDFGYSFIKSSYLKGGLFDPDIFGGSGEIPVVNDKSDRYDVSCFGTGMGFITLPCRVVLPSSYHTVAHLLKMAEKDVEKVAKCVSYIVVDPGSSGLAKGQVISDKDYGTHKDSAVLMCGGDALYRMLYDLGYNDCPERLAFDTIPVAAPCVRPMFYCTGTGLFCSHPLNAEYDRVINRARRVGKLRSLGVPDIIYRNECRMLSERVESLIDRAAQAAASNRTRKDAAGEGYRIFRISQFSMARMVSVFSARTIKPVKTGEIKSLGIYPETVRVLQGDGTVTGMPLEDVYGRNLDALSDARTGNAVAIPDGCDPENLPPELQEEIDRADGLISDMEAVLDEVIDRARKERESFTVKLSENRMYVPLEKGN